MQVYQQGRQDDEEPVGDGVVELGDVLRVHVVGLAPVHRTAVVLHEADIHRPDVGLVQRVLVVFNSIFYFLLRKLSFWCFCEKDSRPTVRTRVASA